MKHKSKAVLPHGRENHKYEMRQEHTILALEWQFIARVIGVRLIASVGWGIVSLLPVLKDCNR
jgi:hypothetical protein